MKVSLFGRKSKPEEPIETEPRPEPLEPPGDEDADDPDEELPES